MKIKQKRTAIPTTIIMTVCAAAADGFTPMYSGTSLHLRE